MNRNKKRQFTDITSPINIQNQRLLKKDGGQFGGQQGVQERKGKDQSPFAFLLNNNQLLIDDDHSTLKPGQNTVVRNPTLLSFGLDTGDYRQQKSQINIQPLNLNNKSPFQVEKSYNLVDTDYKSAYDFNINEMNDCLSKIPNTNKRQEDITRVCFESVAIINDISQQESNPRANDISNVSSRGHKYEYSPFQFISGNQYNIPTAILIEFKQLNNEDNKKVFFDCGIFNSLNVAYFIINKTLLLWNFTHFSSVGQELLPATDKNHPIAQTKNIYKQIFDQIITSIALFDELPNHSIKIKTELNEKILLVATIVEIKVYILKKGIESNDRIQLFETGLSTLIEDNPVRKIIQFEKNGRIFYGGDNGKLYELNIDQSESNFIYQTLFNRDNKRLKKQDKHEESILQKLLPSFLKISDKKEIIDLKIDEARNILYSLAYSAEKDQSNGQGIIEVYDLGILQDKFTKIIQIKQYELVKEILKFKAFSDIGRDIFEESRKYKIVYIHPISFSESQSYHLLIVTENGFRIFIQFMIKTENIPDEQEIQKSLYYKSVDFIVEERFTDQWIIKDILTFPNEDAARDVIQYRLKEGAFRIHLMNHYTTQIPLDQHCIFYNNDFSYLVYGSSITQELENDTRKVANRTDENEILNIGGIKLNFIKKNEGSYAIYKKYLQEFKMNIQLQQEKKDDKFKPQQLKKAEIYENYQNLILPQDKISGTVQQTQQQKIKQSKTSCRINEQEQQQINRTDRLSYSLISENSQHDTEIVLDVKSVPLNITTSNNVQALLGLNQFNSYQFCTQIKYKYTPLTELEKQVYIPPTKTNVLTSSRLIEIIMLRPIDHLAIILNNMTHSLDYVKDIEDFFTLYTIREVCSMCVQILAEPNNNYIFSKKINDLINLTLQEKQEKQKKAQTQQKYSGYTPGFGNTQESINRNKSIYQTQNNQTVTNCYQSTYANMQDKIFENKEYVYKHPSSQLKQMALKVLQTYGESYGNDINDMYIKSEGLMTFILPKSIKMLSYKLQGVYLYLQRVLRPIWDSALFAGYILQNNQQGLTFFSRQPVYEYRAYPNFQNLDVMKSKLKGLQDLINKEEQSFYFQNLPPTDIQSIQLLFQSLRVFQLAELGVSIQDDIERVEKQEFQNLRTFIQRSIETIELYELITFDSNIDAFIELQKFLMSNQGVNLSQLEELTFQDLVVGTQNYLIRKLLEASVTVQQNIFQTQNQKGNIIIGQDATKKNTDILKRRAARARKLCNSLFTENENRIFLGESLLKNAVKETNIQVKEDLLKQAIDYLSRNPLEVDLYAVVPLLVECGNYSTIIDLCIRKARSLMVKQEQVRLERIEVLGNQYYDTEECSQFFKKRDECYTVAVSLFIALDQQIINASSQDKQIFSMLALKNNSTSINFIDQEMDYFGEIFIKKFKEISKVELKIQLLKRITKKINDYNEAIINLSILDYVTSSRPKEKFDFACLPEQSDESFKKFCMALLNDKQEFEKNQYDNIIKIMKDKKIGDVEFLAQFVLLVCGGNQLNRRQLKTTVKGISQTYNMSVNERIIQIDICLNILLERKNEISMEKQQSYNSKLKTLKNALTLQSEVLEYLNNKIKVINSFITLRKSPDYLKLHKEKIGLTPEEELLKRLTNFQKDLNTETFSLYTLSDLAFQHDLFDALLDLLVNKTDNQNIYENDQEKINELISLTTNLFQNKQKYNETNWQSELCSTISQIFYHKNNIYLKNVIQTVRDLNYEYYKKQDKDQETLHKNLISEMEKIKKGLTLKDASRYWLHQFVFENSQHFKLKTSEIITLLMNKQQNIDAENEDYQFEYVVSFISLYIQWIKKNQELFYDTTLDLSNLKQINNIYNSQISEKTEFIKDLTATSKTHYTAIREGFIVNFIKGNDLIFPKQISQNLKELYDKMKDGFYAMCLQHNIKDIEPIKKEQQILRHSQSISQYPYLKAKPIIANSNIIKDSQPLLSQKFGIKSLSKEAQLNKSLFEEDKNDQISKDKKDQIQTQNIEIESKKSFISPQKQIMSKGIINQSPFMKSIGLTQQEISANKEKIVESENQSEEEDVVELRKRRNY